MHCPHCNNVGPCVWVGFGKDWVLCQFCQRRVRWVEVKAKHLITDEQGSESTAQKAAAYH